MGRNAGMALHHPYKLIAQRQYRRLYLGLFNCTICIPQIIAALVGGWILTLLSTPDQLAPEYLMIMIAGISLIIGSFCVFFIKEGKSSDTPVQENPVESETL